MSGSDRWHPQSPAQGHIQIAGGNLSEIKDDAKGQPSPICCIAMSSGKPKTRLDAGPSLMLAEEFLTWREVDGEVVILDRRSWMYMGVNGSGVLLWKQIVEGASRSELGKCLCDAYKIDAELAQRDVEEFLEMLRTHNLLVEDDVG